MKRRVVLATINFHPHRFSLSIEFLAGRLNSEFELSRKIRLIKKVYPCQTPRKKVLRQILKHSPHLVGFSCYIWNISQILQLARDIKNDSPQTLIVLGGPETAGIARKTLQENPQIDSVVMGEGEETFARLMAGWLQNDKLAPVPGAAVRQGKRICVGPARPPIEDLDKIPSPYEHLKPSVFKIPGRFANTVPPIQTLRGCNKGCFYCYYGKNFPHVRFFSLGRVEEDLERFKAVGQKAVGLIDPNFFCNHRHARGVIGLLSEKGLEFQVETNAEDLDEKVIDILVGSTCYQVNVGLQSANPTALKLCGRPFNLKRFETNLRLLAKKAPHIPIKLDLIYGLPGDTFATFLDSVDFALSLPLKQIIFFQLSALPGTPFYKNPQEWGIEFDPEPPRTVYKTGTFSARDIKRAGRVAWVVSYLTSSGRLQPVLDYIFKKIPHSPSRFIDRFAGWDRKRKKRFIMAQQNTDPKKELNLADLRYFLSGVNHVCPGIFSTEELEFIREWYRFKRCFHRLEKRSPPAEDVPDISDGEGVFWKCSDNLIMNRFSLRPNLRFDALVPEPLQDKRRRLVLQKDSKGMVRIYEVSEGVENLLKYFRKPRVLKSYLTAPGDEPAVERHIRIQYARQKGFIRAVTPG